MAPPFHYAMNLDPRPPTISVVMSAYNAELFVADAIQSILDQTFGDFELIVLNDGSTDQTAEVIRSFTDRRILFLDEAKNRGLANRLNQGYAVAKGMFIARMDADDTSLPQRFEKQLAYMEANPDVGVLGTNEIRVGLKLNPLDNSYIQQRDVANLPISNVINHASVMIRRSLLPQWARYNEEYLCAEDYGYWLDLLPHVKIANMNEALVTYRQHPHSAGRTQPAMQDQSVIRAKVKFIQQHFHTPMPRKHRAAWGWLAGNDTTIHFVQFFALFSFLEGKTLAGGLVSGDKIELTPRMLKNVIQWNIKHRRDSLKHGIFDKINFVYKRQCDEYKIKYNISL